MSDSDHGRLLLAWDIVPNDLLSVSRSSRSRTPNAVCVAERSRQPRAKQVNLFFGSGLADHLVGYRLLRPVTTFDSTSLADGVSFLVSLGLLSTRSLGGKEGGGMGGGNLGVLLVPAPAELPAGPGFLAQPVLKFADVILVFVLQSASWAPAGGTLVSRYFQSWTSSLRARATIPIRRCRLLPRPKRA